MSQSFSIPIEKVVDLLGLSQDPKTKEGAPSFNCRCPFCSGNGKKYKMNIDTGKQTYHCVKCTEGGGTLDLYSKVKYGKKLSSFNSKEIFRELIKDLGNQEPISAAVHGEKPREQYQEIFPENDEKLNLAYSALLNLPYLALSEEHRENLYKRGLTEEDIICGGYATMPEAEKILAGHPLRKEAAVVYENRRIEDYRRKNAILCRYTQAEIMAGIIIAGDITRQNIPVSQVPGFFMIGGVWCLRVNKGMLIPTRNEEGRIVGIQTRADAAEKKRYMTLSSKGLESGPTVRISRMHFPLANAGISSENRIVLTEGPLKSDVAVSLFNRLGQKDISFIAIQGVNNTAELKEYAETLVKRGVRTVYTALDMDKTTNIYVAKAGRAITLMFREFGIRTEALLWDNEYAFEREAQLQELCNQRNIAAERTDNPFINIAAMTQALAKCGVTLNENERWNPKTKGIDDFLLTKM